MEYRIKSIKHSGRMGLRGTDRTDGRYPGRIGRVVDLKPTECKIGQPFVLNYLRLADGSDYSNMYLRCSRLVNFTTINGDMNTAETNNTIYEFEKC